MIRLGIALAVLCGLVLGIVVLRAELRDTRAALAAAEAKVVGYAEADRWRRADAKRVAEAAALDETLRTGVGADAPLSDYLRTGAGRVWP
ncbi:MAG: hypothetical protein U1E58_10235 [Tabrizicola sp.]